MQVSLHAGGHPHISPAVVLSARRSLLFKPHTAGIRVARAHELGRGDAWLHYSPYHIWVALRPPPHCMFPLTLRRSRVRDLAVFASATPRGDGDVVGACRASQGVLGMSARTRVWCARSHDRIGVACMHMHISLPLADIYTLTSIHTPATRGTAAEVLVLSAAKVVYRS